MANPPKRARSPRISKAEREKRQRIAENTARAKALFKIEHVRRAAGKKAARTRKRKKKAARQLLSKFRTVIVDSFDSNGNPVDGRSREGWHLMMGHMRARSKKFLQYMELATEECGLSYGEAVDAWFSPEAVA